MNRPILSIMQLHPDDRPEFPILQNSELLIIVNSLIFYHADLCTFHQMYSSQHVQQNKQVESFTKELDKIKKKCDESSDEDELAGLEISYSRVREIIYNNDLMLARTKYFANSSFVISLWATVEQFTSRILLSLEKQLGMTYSEPPHIWDKKIARYKKFNIDITAYLNYENIKECRVLNNKIKHVGKVDDALAKFSFFSDLKNKSLEEIEYDLQRYSKSVFEYIGFVAERAERIIP